MSHRYEYSLLIEGENGCVVDRSKASLVAQEGLAIFSARKARRGAQRGRASLSTRRDHLALKSGPRCGFQNKEAETSGRDNFSTLAMVATAARSAEQARKVSVSELVDFIAPENGDTCFATG